MVISMDSKITLIHTKACKDDDRYEIRIIDTVLDFTIKRGKHKDNISCLKVFINELSTPSNLERIHDTSLENTEMFMSEFLALLINFVESVKNAH